MCCYGSLIAQPRNRNYSLFSHALRPPAMQGATLISNSRLTTPPAGALRWVGRVLVDEAKRPKPESRDGPAYFAMLTLFGSWLFEKLIFARRYVASCLVPVGFEPESFELLFRACRDMLWRNHLLPRMPQKLHLVYNHWKVFLCVISFCVINFM